MSTRAVYTFKGFGEEYHVYKHYDGYPSGAARWIGNALAFAWDPPRYEPDEFAAAFVAGNKTGGGDVRLMSSRRQACDVEFGYTIYPLANQQKEAFPSLNVGELLIDVVATNYWPEEGADDDVGAERLIFRGKLSEFLERAAEIETEYMAS